MATIKTRNVATVQQGNIGGGFLSPSASARSFSEGAEDLRFVADIGTKAADTYIRVENARLKREEAERARAEKALQIDANKYVSDDAYLNYTLKVAETEEYYKNLKGKSGYDKYAESKEAVLKLRQQYIDGLSNPNQVARFTALSRQTTSGALNRILKHQTKELDRFKKEVNDASSKVATDEALRNMYSVEGVGIDYQTMTSGEITVRVNTRAKFAGEKHEFIKQKEDEAAEAYHKQAVDKLFKDGSYALASQYMDAYSEVINPTYAADMGAKVDAEMFEGKVQRQAMNIMNHTNNMDKQLEAADRIKDPKERKAVRTEITQRNRILKQAREYKKDVLAEDAWKDIWENETIADKWRDPELRVEDRMAMKKIIDQLRAADYSETEVHALYEVLGSPNFKNLDLRKYEGRIHPKKIAELMWKQRVERNKKTPDETKNELRRARTMHSQVQSHARNTISNEKKREYFVQDAHAAIEAERRRQGLKEGKYLSEGEIQKIITEVSREVVYDRDWMIDTTVPLYVMKRMEEEEIDQSFEHRKSWPAALRDNRNIKYEPAINRFVLEDANKKIYYDLLGRITLIEQTNK